MTDNLETLLEGGPSYGVLDAKDGVLLYGRPGHEKEFSALAAEVEAADGNFQVIPLKNADNQCDRLFIAPLSEEKSFAR